MRSVRRRTGFLALMACALVLSLTPLQSAPVSAQQSYQRISGEGSSWSASAIDAMRVNVKQFGITVDYNPSGSTAGRKNWLNGTVDFAASDIPFQFRPEDGSAPENPEDGSYAYIPVTAGGTAFMYNLKIGGQRVTNLRLSGENAVKLFTGAITQWNDPAIAADNPGLDLPARKVVPVVRSDGSGSTAQFTQWMIARHKGLWDDYCRRSGRAPACGFTSFYPTMPGMIAQSGDLGVSGYVSQGFAEGAIGYVNYSYALGAGFPVAKVLNQAGFYTEPTPENVAVSLLKAGINNNKADKTVYLTQDLNGVYTDPDPRNYQLSSYSYFILPTKVRGQFNEAKGRTLGAFAYYAMCQAQQQSASLGYSPMPINLVQASFEQIRLIPGVEVQNVNIQQCKNPTFSADGTNVLAANAPQPSPCDKRGATQTDGGTAGARNQPTPVKASAACGGGGAPGGNAPGGGNGPGGDVASGAPGGGTAVDVDGDGIADSPDGGSIDPSGDGLAVCDPETGVCGDGSGLSSRGGTSAVSGEVASATPSVLPADEGWSSTQTLMVLIVMLVIALVCGPAVVFTKLSAVRT